MKLVFSSTDRFVLFIISWELIFCKLLVVFLLISCISSTFTIKSSEIASVNLDSLLGAAIDKTDDTIAKIKAIAIRIWKLFSSLNKRFIEPTKSLDLSIFGPRGPLCIF